MIRALLIFLLVATATLTLVAFWYGPWAAVLAWVGTNAGFALGLVVASGHHEVVS